MLEFLFGWLIKPEIQITLLDKIIFYIELLILFILFILLFTLIQPIKDKRKNKGDN